MSDRTHRWSPPPGTESLFGPGGPFALAEEDVFGVPVTVFARRLPNLRAQLVAAAERGPDVPYLVFADRDLTVHAWDLARAIGQDLSLDPDLVAVVWGNVEPMLGFIATTGVFGAGPSGTVPDDAPLERRLLDAMGRRP